MLRIARSIARSQLVTGHGQTFLLPRLRQGTEAPRRRAPHNRLEATPTKNRP
ncbi:hypothetical protein [Nocardiopsis sp. JB363]|uniref:hypothetical protein n=1 Tax=Nocardiopsis sp. JB363 TaxID=1434837 RepID=UPI00097AC7E2|nr:hypothetical protein [Nocardiopsis sp. JB363]SIO87025.1 hypothetical protein BQ8420_14730 [Nocardiopsis sp. JB363]